jgi:hypothetical protein
VRFADISANMENGCGCDGGIEEKHEHGRNSHFLIDLRQA